MRSKFIVLFVSVLLAGLVSPSVWGQTLDPSCIQNGGSYECVPHERLGPMIYTGSSNDHLASSLLGVLTFSSAEAVQGRVEAGFANTNFAACRSWSQVQPWTSMAKLLPCGNGHYPGWCVTGEQNAFPYIADEEIRLMKYAANCSDVPSQARLSIRRDQIAYCPSGFVPNTYGQLKDTYCVGTRNRSYSPMKNNGCSQNAVGNPCNAATGNKYQRDIDYVAPNAGGLEFVRVYNSSTGKWTHTYSDHITVKSSSPAVFGNQVTMHRADGREYTFLQGPNNTFLADPDLYVSLVPIYVDGSLAGWQYTDANGTIENYDSTGRLTGIRQLNGLAKLLSYGNGAISVQDSFKRTIEIYKNSHGQLTKVVDPAKNVFLYSYDEAGNLTVVQYPDLAQRVYHYNETAYTGGLAFLHALTGITDENGKRFATFAYDAWQRAVMTEHAAGVGRFKLKFLDDGTEVTDPLGTERMYWFTAAAGTIFNSGISMPCESCGDNASSKTYDGNGNLTSRTDHKGIVTTYEYDERGREISRTLNTREGEERIITTEWHNILRKPITINDGNRMTEFNYDVKGNLLSKIIRDKAENTSIKQTFKYNNFGQLTEIDGPRTDVADISRFVYDLSGNLTTATNALGHITRFTSYDAHGRPAEVIDPNGLTTKLSYDKRGRIVSRIVGQKSTSYFYDGVGQLLKVILPTGDAISYTYDDAHRLTDIRDSTGARIHYTLDAADNLINAEIFDEDGNLSRESKATFNHLGSLQKIISSNNRETLFEYDENGNVTTITDPLLRQTFFNLDALDRTREVIFPDESSIKIDYDMNDQVTTVTNARESVVTYTRNSLAQTKQVESDDFEPYVIAQQYDKAGNVKSKVEARGITTSYTYDALNRLTSISAPNVTTSVYSYDAGPNGKGRLTSMADESGSTSFVYNSQGRIDSVSRMLNGLSLTTRHVYDTAGRLIQLIYPSGRAITYRYEKGQIRGIDIGTTPLLSQISYDSFDSPRSWRWANGQNYLRTRNLDGDVTSFPEGAVQKVIERDEYGNIIRISAAGDHSRTQRFAYDAVNRITEYLVGLDTTPKESYRYDRNGNRTSLTVLGVEYPYVYDEEYPSDFLLTAPGPVPRNWIADMTSLRDGTHVFVVDGLRRISSVSSGGKSTSYLRNAFHQRVTKKSSNGNTMHYVYDEEGHLLAELDGFGVSLREHVWLGDQPVAVLDRGEINYVYADHLNTPRLITDTSNRVRWSWLSDPFGRALPDSNPANLGSFEYNLRFPGQYYDVESGLHHNYFRDYDPQTGRYIQSDPIGLDGGLNTYVYARANPLTRTDPYGLQDSVDRHNRPLPVPSPIQILAYYSTEMKRVGLLEPADDVFHCIAACKAIKNGGKSEEVRWWMDLKEDTDFIRNRFGLYREKRTDTEMVANMNADKAVNEVGIRCPPEKTCEQQCEPYVQALPPKSETIMRNYLKSPAYRKY